MNKLLTIGMSTFDDFDGVFFTTQALRMFHPICNTNDIEFIILDNNPKGSHGAACKNFANSSQNIRYIELYDQPSSFNKYKIVNYATGKYVLILDCHVLIQDGGINHLVDYFRSYPNCKHLVQGPLLYDDLQNISTHFDPIWRGDMYGIWATDTKSYITGEPFEIPMQGMGLLAFEKSAWKGINQNFKGFGGEEGYIAEKFRQWGGKNICLPKLKWNHRFGRPNGVQYPLILEDRILNYFIGWLEITQDEDHQMIQDIKNHFKNRVPEWSINNILNQAKLITLNTEKKDANS
jgi:hypothetical protein